MQPVEALNGVSTKSQLLESLKVYLSNKNRLQPIIGLGSIIECVKVGMHDGEALYLCKVCVCRVSKADIRNHIMGSLHRYNYIKAWHPHLVSEWKENSDLSKLAWPLMEKAKILERTEGPGDVYLLETEDVVYQRMATCSENDAVTLINFLRDGQGQAEGHLVTVSKQPKHSPVQSSRIVLLGQKHQKWPKKSFGTSEDTNEPPSLISVLSGKSNSFLDDYTGTKPLIGLPRVVECRGEDGHTYCFLCHCCRIRSNKQDIIDHLTSSSHLVNYLMETHPEQVGTLPADSNDHNQRLQSLAVEVQQEGGRGQLKVVNAPESLCSQLTGKSYHWCIKMLCNGWPQTNIRKRKVASQGPTVNTTSDEGIPDKSAALMKITPKRKKREKNNTVFKVSLPLSKGAVVLERTSLSVDSLPLSPEHLPPSDSDLIPSPESQSEDCELDLDTESNLTEHTSVNRTSRLHQDPHSGDADSGQYMGPEGNFVSHYHNVDGYFSDHKNAYQSENVTGPKDQMFYGENCDKIAGFYKEWHNEGPQTQRGPAVSQTQDWSAYNSFYRQKEGFSEQWYISASQVEVSRNERWNEMSSDAAQYYYQQQPQDQYMAQIHAASLTGSAGQHGLSGELAQHVGATWINMYSHVGTYSGNAMLAPTAQFPQPEQIPCQTNMGYSFGQVQTAPQSYVTTPTTQQAMQWSHEVTSNTNYSTGPVTNADQQLSHPTVIWSSRS